MRRSIHVSVILLDFTNFTFTLFYSFLFAILFEILFRSGVEDAAKRRMVSFSAARHLTTDKQLCLINYFAVNFLILLFFVVILVTILIVIIEVIVVEVFLFWLLLLNYRSLSRLILFSNYGVFHLLDEIVVDHTFNCLNSGILYSFCFFLFLFCTLPLFQGK